MSVAANVFIYPDKPTGSVLDKSVANKNRRDEIRFKKERRMRFPMKPGFGEADYLLYVGLWQFVTTSPPASNVISMTGW